MLANENKTLWEKITSLENENKVLKEEKIWFMDELKETMEERTALIKEVQRLKDKLEKAGKYISDAFKQLDKKDVELSSIVFLLKNGITQQTTLRKFHLVVPNFNPNTQHSNLPRKWTGSESIYCEQRGQLDSILCDSPTNSGFDRGLPSW